MKAFAVFFALLGQSLSVLSLCAGTPTLLPQASHPGEGENSRTGAIAAVYIDTGATSVFHCRQHRQGVFDNVVGFATFQVRNKSDTTSIVFKFRTI